MKNKTSNLTVVPQSLERQAADVIREQILNGKLPPDTRLLEIQLAEEFNISRGSVRSALQQLTYEGLVVQFPYKGCVVSGLSAQDAWELYTLRNALEGLAAQLAAEAMTLDKADVLNAAFQELVEAVQNNNWAEVTEADFLLHQTIIQLSGHRRLQEQYRIIEQQIRLYIASCNATRPDLAGIVEQHEHLVKAICSGDSSTAEQIAREHNVDGKALIEHLQASAHQAPCKTQHFTQ